MSMKIRLNRAINAFKSDPKKVQMNVTIPTSARVEMVTFGGGAGGSGVGGSIANQSAICISGGVVGATSTGGYGVGGNATNTTHRITVTEPTSSEGIAKRLNQIDYPSEVASRLDNIAALKVIPPIVGDDLRECARHLRTWLSAHVVSPSVKTVSVPEAQEGEWKIHSQYHRSMTIMGKRLNVWTNEVGVSKAQYADRMYYGGDVNALFRQLGVRK